MTGLKIKRHDGWFEVYYDCNKLFEAKDDEMSIDDLFVILNKISAKYRLEISPPNYDISGI